MTENATHPDSSDATTVKMRAPWWRNVHAVWAVFLLSLLVTIEVWHLSNQYVEDRINERFAFRAAQAVDSVIGRMHSYEQVLRGGVGLFIASPTVSKQQWHEYVENLNMPEQFPGIQNMAVDFPIPAAEKEAHVSRMRALGFSDYSIKPEQPERPVYHTLAYVEPFAGRNLRAFGFDMYTNPTRRAAMDRAIDEGLPTISGMVKLAQETNQDVQNGFIFCLPVYQKGRSISTPTERRAALHVLVCAGFRANDLMRGIFGSSANDVELEIFDDGIASLENRLYTSRVKDSLMPVSLSRNMPIEIGGRKWLLRIHANHKFIESASSLQSHAIAVAGIVFNIALLITFTTLVGRESKARKLADEMTVQIRENEKHLAKINQRFELAANSAGIAVWEYDIVSDALVWDDRMYQLYQVDRNEFTPDYSVWQSRLHPDDGRRTEAELQAAISDHKDYDTNFRIITRNDGVRDIKAHGCVEYDQAGRPLRMTGINYDVTATRQAETALRESAQYTQTILDNVLDGIITIDERGIVDTFNKSAEKIFGFTMAEIVGKNVGQLIPEPHGSKHDSYLRNYLTTGKKHVIGINREVSGLRKDGATFAMELSVSEISHAGRHMFIGLIRDINERKQAERMKSEFVSTVSHELRTPLTSIYGALDLLAGGVLGELPEEVRQLIDMALKNSQRLNNLINDLLDMEKIAAGKLDFDMVTQALMPLIDHALEVNQAYGKQHEVTFRIVERMDGINVRVDGHRLIQVLSNYLSNAAKFSPSQADVEVAVSRMGEYVRVSVHDHGPGVPAEFRKRVFEKFSQADSSDTRQKEGTGLGLAITRELVTHMGGKVGFESVEGKGSTFFFDLPVCAVAPVTVTVGVVPRSGIPLAQSRDQEA
jgi:PAS domain S-box-containing protein